MQEYRCPICQNLLVVPARESLRRLIEAHMREEHRARNTFCSYCKRQTFHTEYMPNKLTCSVCGSARLSEIQGFDASLM